MAPKRLLIVAYTFPPAANVGIYRPLKFAKFMPSYGWQAEVLTVEDGKFPKYDERLLGLIPADTKVHRARSIEWLNEGQNRASAGQSQRRTFLSRVYKRLCLVANYFLIPDGKITWVPFATVKAVDIVKRSGINHLFVTAKPFSAFIVGYLVKQLTGVRLIIDYRDPWTQNINYESRSPIHRSIERRLERAIIRQSDLVIANTWVNEELLVRDFGNGQPRGKFVTIHNGFDSEDFDTAPSKPSEKFTITYAGAFYFSVGSSYEKSAGNEVMRTYSPLYFFDAVKSLVNRRPDIGENLRINFMGPLGHGFQPVIKEMGLDSIIHWLGYLDYDDHIAVLKNSSALLLVLSRGEKSRGWIPSKFFSYLGSGNPILAMVPEGEVRDIIRTTQGGVFVEPDDPVAAEKAIEKLFDEYYAKGRRFSRKEDEVRKFDRRALTARLADAIDRLSDGGRA